MADYQTWAGKTVYDSEGRKIGAIADLYFDEDATKPVWATIHSGMFGTKVHFVPLRGATENGKDIHVVVTENQVKDAPSLSDGNELEPEEEDRLYQHYGMQIEAGEQQRDQDTGQEVYDDHEHDDTHIGMQDRHDETTPNVTNRDMTQNVITGDDTPDTNATSQPSGPVSIGRHPVTGKRVRLQKYIVTEMVQTTVPIQHEEVRVVGEPISDGPATADVNK